MQTQDKTTNKKNENFSFSEKCKWSVKNKSNIERFEAKSSKDFVS
jgi:hypothetical protein